MRELTMSEQKERHGCLTAWLIFVIITNSIGALMYLFFKQFISQSMPDLPGWAFPVLAVFSLFGIVCAVALFKWKKWGFWGFCGSTIATIIFNLYLGFGIVSSLSVLIGVAVLFAVLHIGKEDKGWTQLD